MDLSIVIVNWNTKDLLRECLNSIARSEHGLTLEIIVVDNASCDGSAEMLRDDFCQVTLIESNRNLGFAGGNNLALKRAAGRYVMLLNTDTLVHGTVLRDAVAWLDENPLVGVMGPRVLNADGSLQPSCSMFPSLRHLAMQTLGLTRVPRWDAYRLTGWDHAHTREVEVISGAAMFVRRSAMQQVGLLDEAFFFFGEETDWCRRFAQSGWRVVFNPIPEITHFGGGSVQSFKHTRDVMMTEATTRLHLKHRGVLGASICFLLLTFHNISRAIFWSIMSLVFNPRAAVRAVHFLRVSVDLWRAWPRRRKVTAIS